MRLVIQSVSSASVRLPEYEGISRSISRGVVIYFGISTADLPDYPEKIEKIVRKLPTIRFLEGEKGINQSLNDVDGEILLISNFTVYGTNHKGTSMEFTGSAPFSEAKAIYDYFIAEALSAGRKLQTGEF
ncbi:MAG: D-aminoacyl-tRNA deacylase [Candidatus Peribacteria bacterium]|jgi:D-tyrosyl-tRNA(Tyr) deacylase|nr:D-aminoacyl-tRNA deacylase [Candidatus Peribacteria bacterium]